jgi:fumarylacetoacetate (FAA) hydrolase
VQINDWSLRKIGAREMRTGFGFLQAKPSTSFAPLAVMPDELGSAWRDGRLDMNLHVALNGERIGSASGAEMNFSFPELIAHCARTRRLTAGTIIGSGTVSNADRAAGSSCLAERRVIEMLDHGAARTPFLKFGDRVAMRARHTDGRDGPFGCGSNLYSAMSAPTQTGSATRSTMPAQCATISAILPDQFSVLARMGVLPFSID